MHGRSTASMGYSVLKGVAPLNFDNCRTGDSFFAVSV